MEKVRRDTNFIVLGLVLYTLLRYVIFALEPLARVCFVRLVCSDSAERTVLCSSWRKTLPTAVFPVLWQCLPACCFWAGISDGIRHRGWCFKKSSRFRGKGCRC